MTKLLEKTLAIVRGLPPAEQDEIAQAILNLADAEADVGNIDPAHLPDVLESLAQARHRDSTISVCLARICAVQPGRREV